MVPPLFTVYCYLNCTISLLESEIQKKLVGHPRAWYEEMAWQAKYGDIGIVDLMESSIIVGALGLAAHTFYKMNGRK